jgi:alginate O-acetyltransferase complex protein AlgI
MAGFGAPTSATTQVPLFLDHERTLGLAAGVIGATPWLMGLRGRLHQRDSWGWELGRVASLMLILLASAMRLSSGTYNPFIYFRF